METRQWPQMSLVRRVVVTVSFILYSVLIAWAMVRFNADWLAWALLAVPGILLLRIGVRRCPKCKGYLENIQEPLEGTRVRLLQACPRCKIIWKTDLIGDTNPGAG